MQLCFWRPCFRGPVTEDNRTSSLILTWILEVEVMVMEVHISTSSCFFCCISLFVFQILCKKALINTCVHADPLCIFKQSCLVNCGTQEFVPLVYF
ncbi:hypothetical protein C5167_034990, partial [Papaver somniferum]